jgi:pilus assembly protein CpaB
MNNQRAILISAVVAAIAMLMVYSYVADKEDAIKKEFGEEVLVLVANQNIQSLNTITADMVSVQAVPKKYLQPGYVTSEEREDLFIHTQTVASAPIFKGEQMLKTKLLYQGSRTGISSQIAVSKRAISIAINDVMAVNKLIKPGDRVDILANMVVKQEKSQENVVKTIMQDVPILAVGDLIQSEIPRKLNVDPVTLETSVQDLRNKKNFNTITFHLDPEQAQKLVWLTTSGAATVYLTLRNTNDRRLIKLTTTTQREVMSDTGRGLAGSL